MKPRNLILFQKRQEKMLDFQVSFSHFFFFCNVVSNPTFFVVQVIVSFIFMLRLKLNYVEQ